MSRKPRSQGSNHHWGTQQQRRIRDNAIEDLSRSRGDVYRNDVPHATPEPWTQVPAKGTSERAALAARIRQMRQDMTLLAISNQLNINIDTVRRLSKEQ